MGVDESEFQISVYEEREGPGNGTLLMTFVTRAVAAESGTFRVHPGYAEYTGLNDLLRLEIPLPPNVRIDVEPLTAGSRYWAFVSITNNDTQRVTTVTPQ
jgi:hypothetical protein